MGNISEVQTWQELLGILIEKTEERQRLALTLHVKPITLQRWVLGVSRPRESNMKQLRRSLYPEYRSLFNRLIAQDFPEVFQEDMPMGQTTSEITSELYERILAAFALTPLPMCRQTIQDFLLRGAIEQLDPERYGMSLSLISCMPPSQGHKVRSLREIGGMGTHPWKHDLEQKMYFFGAESMIGYTIMHLHHNVINSKEELTFCPVQWTDHEKSAATFPVLNQARVAGGLVASSSIEHFFTEARVALLQDYANLAGLIFEPKEYHAFADIDLWEMPDYKQQEKYMFRQFNQRISRKFSDALNEQKHLSIHDAKLQAWQDMETEMLREVVMRHSE
jgi:hypothetical protein